MNGLSLNNFLKTTFLGLVLALSSHSGFSQCGDSIDLGTWIQEGVPGNGTWTVTGGGNAVNQTINGNPTFYVSPDSFINVIITGDIEVQTNQDNDWVGFVFGYVDPDSNNTNDYDFYLFDWKKGPQNFGGWFGDEGYALTRIDGPVVNFPQAFSAKAGPFANLLASQYGAGEGWNDNQVYTFALTYTNTRTVIAIDGDTIFDLFGCFPPGRFGFYNYSQSNVNYSNFSYQVAAAFDVLTPNVCFGDTAKFVALSDSCENAAGIPVNNTLVGWFWDFGDGNTSTDTNGQHVYGAPGVYEVSLEVTDYLGCKDTAYSQVEIYEIGVELGNDTIICDLDSITLDAGTLATNYIWSDGSTNQTLTVTDSGEYTVTVSNIPGCVDSDTVHISLYALPQVNLGNDTGTCNGDTITLFAGNPQATAYLWSDGSTLDQLALVDSGTYWVQVTDTTTCVNSDTIEIVSLGQPTVSPPNPTLCFGDTITITATGAENYIWSPFFEISSDTGTSILAWTSADTTYGVVGLDSNGCSDTSFFFVDVYELPTVDISGGGPICDGDSTAIYLNLTGVGPWDVVYTFDGDTFNLNGIVGPVDSMIVSDSGIYKTIYVSDTRCENFEMDSVALSIIALPIVNLGNDTGTCNNDSVILYAGNPQANSYLWSDGSTLDSLALADSGIYWVEVTDSTFCVNSDTIEVISLGQPTVSPPNPSLCFGDTITITAVGAETYVWSPFFQISTDTGTSIQAWTTSDTTYGVIGLDSNGCSDTSFFFVDVYELPTVDIAGGDSICVGDSLQLFLNLTGVGPWDVQYTFDGDTFLRAGITDTIDSFVVADSGYYKTIYVSDSRCENFAVDSTLVFFHPLPTITLNIGADSICYGDSMLAVASGAETYTWSPHIGLSDTIGDSIIAHPLAPFYYTVEGTSEFGCQDTSGFLLTVLNLPILTPSITPNPVCLEDTVTLSVAGADTYLWIDQNNNDSLIGDSVQFIPITLPTAKYSVWGTDTFGCMDSVHVTVSVDTLPVVTIAPSDTAYCIEDSALLTASGAVTYLWWPTAGLSDSVGATIAASPTDTTTYYVEGTDANGCRGYDTATVNIWPLPVISIVSDTDAICFGDTLELSATGTQSYEWLTNYNITDTLGDSTSVYAEFDTSYVLLGTDGNGCQNTDTFDLTVYPLPIITLNTIGDSICGLDTTTIIAGGAVTYAWTNTPGLDNYDQSVVNASPPVTSTFEVFGTDANGCVNSNDTVVIVLPLPDIVLTPAVGQICVGESAELTAPTYYTHTWTPTADLQLDGNNNDTVIASPVDTTVYMVHSVDTFGCESDTSYQLAVTPLPILEVTASDTMICTGSPTQLLVTGANTYSWSPNIYINGIATANPTVSPLEDQMYYVVGTGPGGCQSDDSIFIDVFPIPTYSAGPDTAMCDGDTLQLEASGGVSYQWSPGTGLTDASIANPMSFTTSTRLYTVSITDSLGCTYTDGMVLTVYELPYARAGKNDTICDDDFSFIGGSPSGPAGSTFAWTPTAGLDDPGISNPTASPDTTTLYEVLVTDQNGCQNTDRMRVFVNPLPEVNILERPDYMCQNDTAVLRISGGLEAYEWTPSERIVDPTLNRVLVFPLDTLNYKAVGIDTNGCRTEVTINLPVKQLPRVNAGPTQEMCYGDTVSLTGSSNALTTRWEPSDRLQQPDSLSTVAYPLEHTTFVLEGTDQFGCSDTDGVFVFVHPLPLADAGDDIDNCNMEVFYLGSDYTTGPENKIRWSPAEKVDNPSVANPKVLSVDRDTFVLEVTSPFGCINHDTIVVNSDCYSKVFVPNAFTPDGDGINDVFYIPYHRVENPQLRIYDRWGILVFETNNLDKGWDGNYRGKQAPIDTYFWELLYETEGGRKLSDEGLLNLIR